jgi:hypothetical protein
MLHLVPLVIAKLFEIIITALQVIAYEVDNYRIVLSGKAHRNGHLHAAIRGIS